MCSVQCAVCPSRLASASASASAPAPRFEIEVKSYNRTCRFLSNDRIGTFLRPEGESSEVM